MGNLALLVIVLLTPFFIVLMTAIYTDTNVKLLKDYLLRFFRLNNKHFFNKLFYENKFKKFLKKVDSETKKINSDITKLKNQIMIIPNSDNFKDLKKIRRKLLDELIMKKENTIQNLVDNFVKTLPVFVVLHYDVENIINDKDILEVYDLICETKFNKSCVIANHSDFRKFRDVIYNDIFNKDLIDNFSKKIFVLTDDDDMVGAMFKIYRIDKDEK